MIKLFKNWIFYSIIDENVVIENGATIGEAKDENIKIAVIGRNTRILKDDVVLGGANIEVKKGEK